MSERTIVKLGGSVITDKSCVQNGMIRSDALRQVAAELKKYPDMPLIIVHGAGSCGHPQAKQYHLDVGVTRENRIGIFETHHAVKTLNEKVVEVLREFDSVEVDPSPKSQRYEVGGPIERSLNWTARGAEPVTGVASKRATGGGISPVTDMKSFSVFVSDPPGIETFRDTV